MTCSKLIVNHLLLLLIALVLHAICSDALVVNRLGVRALAGRRDSLHLFAAKLEIRENDNSLRSGNSEGNEKRDAKNIINKALSRTLLLATSFVSNIMPMGGIPRGASNSASSSMVRTTIGAATASATLVAMPEASFAGVLKPFNRNKTPLQKLATTPLFYVCNSGGSPYLQEDVQAGKAEQRIVVYFMSSEDANEYLNEIAQGSPQNINEFRLMATSMEKVVAKIQSRKQSRKLGRYPIGNVYRIQPSKRQSETAEGLLGKTGSSAKTAPVNGISIPMFFVDGLIIKRPNGELVTPYYFAYEDLLDDWSRVEVYGQKSSKQASAVVAADADALNAKKPLVKVKDFRDVMCLSQGITDDRVSSLLDRSGAKPSPAETASEKEAVAAATSKGQMSSKQIAAALKNPGIVPPKREIDMIGAFYRNKAGLKNEFQQARIMPPPRER